MEEARPRTARGKEGPHRQGGKLHYSAARRYRRKEEGLVDGPTGWVASFSSALWAGTGERNRWSQLP